MRVGNDIVELPPYEDHLGLWADALSAWVPDRVFDAHAHLAPPEAVGPYSDKRLGVGLCKFGSLTWEEYQTIQARLFGGKQLAGLIAFALPVREVNFEVANAYVRHLMKREPSVKGFLIAHPTDVGRTRAEFERSVADGVPFRGAKPYFDFLGKSNYETTMPEFIPEALLDFMDAEELVLMLHTSGRGMGVPENQAYVRSVLERFPRVRIILAHMGRFLELSEFMAFADSGLLDHPNLYLDMSYVAHREIYERTLRVHSTHDRLLFATDMPYGTLTAVEITSEPTERLTYNTYHVIRTFKQAVESVVPDEAAAESIKRRVFHDNAAALFDGCIPPARISVA